MEAQKKDPNHLLTLALIGAMIALASLVGTRLWPDPTPTRSRIEIQGDVVDAQGVGVAEAQVRMPGYLSVPTDARGHFTFKIIVAMGDSVRLRVEHEGFEVVEQVCAADPGASCDFVLTAGTLGEN